MVFPAQVFHDRSESREEVAANTRLIAAAPDLLAALEDIASQLKGLDLGYLGIRTKNMLDAIAKATGAA